MILFAGFFSVLLGSCFVSADSSSDCTDDSLVESCADRYGYGLSFSDVINLMRTSPAVIPFYCQRGWMDACVGNCGQEYRTSKYGHTYSMCLFKRDIVKYKRCWTDSFQREAQYCYAHHYPSHRADALFPTPIRLYSMSTIEQDCFSQEQDEDCRYYKSLLMWNLLPTYYQTNFYPEEYRSRFMRRR